MLAKWFTMQTKNINHDYHHHKEIQQANQHHPGCASFHLRAQPQSTTATAPASSRLNTCPVPVNGGTCHHRSKTPVPPNAIATINNDDSYKLETVQVPTSEAHHQRQYLSANEGSAQPRPMTSQGALILVDSTTTTTTQSAAQSVKLSMQQVPQSRTFARDDCIIEDYDTDLETTQQQCHLSRSSTLGPQHQKSSNMSIQQRRASCLSGSQPSLSTLAAFVTGASSLYHHQPSGHQHRSSHSPSQQMLLCAANSKTPLHQVAQPAQRCLANEPNDASLSVVSSLSSHKPHSNFGHSSTLPPNSTLSSLLASAKGNSDQLNMQPHELRRQISMSHLDKVAETKSKASILTRGEAKLGSFQQRLKAILSTPKDFAKMNGKSSKLAIATTSTYRSGEDIDLAECDQNDANGDVLSVRASVHSKDQTSCSSRPLSTLNKYTISVSSTNLSPHGASSTTSFVGDTYDEEDSFHLRNVCNKLFSQKQYSCLHSTSSQQLLPDNVMSTMQKSSISDQNCYRNITPEMNVDKVNTKENIYSAYNRNAISTNTTSSHQLTSSGINLSSAPLNSVPESVEYMPSYSTMNDNHVQSNHEHVVVVSELSPKTPTSISGLTVRSQTPNGRLSSPKISDAQNEGSTLSLNVGIEASESVASQDHSSESGRGTMNSHLEERSQHHIDLNSPADLTSLDSDQSGHQEANWKESTNGNCARRPDPVNMNSYSTIQRYLDDQQRSSKEADLSICKDFKSKLSLNDESDSWTSMSDEPSTKKGSSKSQPKAKAPAISKNRHQPDSKLKTNFSKPENCLSPNSKQTALMSTKPISPAVKPKITTTVPKMIENESKPQMNGMHQLYDKSCIYSVPNKGKYRNLAQYGNVPCEGKVTRDAPYVKECSNGSLSSDPESNFPDDGCSEFTDFNHEHHDPLRKQLRGIEDMYSELLTMLNNKSDHKPRRKLYRRNSGRSSVASRNTRDYINRRYRSDHRRSKPDDLQLSRRYKKLESQVLTLAKSVSQLSADIQFNYMLNEEMESLRHEVEMLKSQMSNVKQNVTTLSKSQQQHQQAAATQQQQVCATLNRSKESKKVDKLKRLFVDEPQPMKQFLKKLGYEKYLKHFEAEKIGLAELVHLNEERLHKLGIPMGPRIRILQEAKNLAAIMTTKTQNGKQMANLSENYNIYAVV